MDVDEENVPTNMLDPMALAACQSVGSKAKTVQDILRGDGDKRVLDMIQEGINTINKRASCRSHKVCVCVCVCVSPMGARIAAFWYFSCMSNIYKYTINNL